MVFLYQAEANSFFVFNSTPNPFAEVCKMGVVVLELISILT